MNELVNRSLKTNKEEFWIFAKTVARADGIEMRKMIQMIDETIRMTKMGTVTRKSLTLASKRTDSYLFQ